MKSYLKCAAIIGIAFLNVSALKAEPYVGVDANYHALDSVSLNSDHAYGWNVHAGYKFYGLAALEVGYANFINGNNNAQGPSIDTNFYVPVGDFPIKPFLTAGVQYVDLKSQVVGLAPITNRALIVTSKSNELDGRFGVGAELGILRVSLKYQNLSYMNKVDHDLITSVGVNFPL